jgi:hypothetical protein
LVAGACALLKQIHPDWTPIQLMTALKNTASLATCPNDSFGWGIIDALAASGLPPLAQAGLHVYPSVFTRELRFSFLFRIAQTVDISLLDAAGRVIRSQTTGALPANQQVLVFDVGPGIRTGVYYVRLRTNGDEWVRRVVKVPE